MSTIHPYPERLPEIWGGMECTINRVGDSYRDQLFLSGHYDRISDIELFASLGISKIRFPLLWEKHKPQPGKETDWTWAQSSLQTLRENKIEPIIGLLHHGSGPFYTSLEDSDFPNLLAAYAKNVAEQFPWVQYYTPVNEPLTTARFSGLYGFWYPHKKEELSFVKMLLNQVKATILCMQEIRKVNPSAKLVQTEDLSKVHSTPLLDYQARFENKRRWLTYDLLTGKFDTSHYFWGYFLKLGIPEAELQFFKKNSCPPDIMGFNYYVTSERYLDENLHQYPSWTHGGNGKHRYADTEAVQVGCSEGLKALMEEAWERYKIPLALTECHLSCTREEQMRWLDQCWKDCCALREAGVDLTALTAWSLLGAYDWNSLLTTENMHYEPGAFDLRGDKPRLTALGRQVRSLAKKDEREHPLLQQEGWWEKKNKNLRRILQKEHKPLLLIGKNGTLARAFSRICEQRSIPYVAQSREDMDIMRPENIREVIDRHHPWAIINTAGFVRVDDAEKNRDECFNINGIAPGLMAEIAKEKGLRFMSFSSDLVFNGEKMDPYHENDSVQPLNVYGASKALGEKNISLADPGSLIIRSSAFFGPWDQYNFIYYVMRALKEGRELPVAKDVIISPTYVPDLVNAALDIFIDEEEGIWHLSNEGSLSWAELAIEVAERNGLNKQQILPVTMEEMQWTAPRPRFSVLVSEKGAKLASLDNALHRYFQECTA